MRYYKVARQDGYDFHTGKTINYRESIGKRVVCPDYGKYPKECCSRGVIHAGKNVLDALRYATLPCSIYEVDGRPVVSESDKAGFKSFRVVREIPESEFNGLLGFHYTEAINPINPLERDNEVTQEDIDNLRKWASVWTLAGDSVKDSISASVYSTRASVWDSVRASGYSIRASVYLTRASVWDSVRASALAYIGSIFYGITDWEYIYHEPGEYPFKCGSDLWRRGFIPLRMDGKWHLWKQNGGIVYTDEGGLTFER